MDFNDHVSWQFMAISGSWLTFWPLPAAVFGTSSTEPALILLEAKSRDGRGKASGIAMILRQRIYPLVMTNSLPWYRWPIEIDGLPNLKMVDLSMAMLNNQMVHFMLAFPHRAGSFTGDTQHILKPRWVRWVKHRVGFMWSSASWRIKRGSEEVLLRNCVWRWDLSQLIWETLAAINLPNLGMIYEVYI